MTAEHAQADEASVHGIKKSGVKFRKVDEGGSNGVNVESELIL